MSEVSVLIPAYQPDHRLIETVQDLIEFDSNVIIINDGSDADKKPLFNTLRILPQVTLLEHETNQGKGAALKKGFQHWCDTYYYDQAGIITADADGQHAPTDILKLAKALIEQPKALHLGCREFSKDIPLRSQFGNILTKWVMRLFTKKPINDTQTGLRALPRDLIEAMLTVKATGYAFETDMLLKANKMNITIQQHEIQTLYFDNNEGSHFRPVLDSIKIYWVFMRYTLVGLFSAGAEFAIFALILAFTGQIYPAVALSRVCSSTLNFIGNRKVVFKNNQAPWQSALKYIALVAVNIQFAYLIVDGLVYLGAHPYAAKISSDVILFFVNFVVQKVWVFKARSTQA